MTIPGPRPGHGPGSETACVPPGWPRASGRRTRSPSGAAPISAEGHSTAPGPTTSAGPVVHREGRRLAGRTDGLAGAGGLPGTGTGPQPRADSGLAGQAETTSPGHVIVPPAPVTVPPGQVIVPSADSSANHERLPIFDAVESHWFSRGRQVIGTTGQGGDGWSSSADDGWRAAEVVHAPSSDGTTSTGLPKRQPQANLVPGTAAAVSGRRDAASIRAKPGQQRKPGIVSPASSAVSGKAVPRPLA